MKTLRALSGVLLIMILILAGCDTDQVTGPKLVNESAELTLHFGVTNDRDYVPFAATTIPMVTGGSGVYSYELYRNGHLLGHDPITTVRFDEVGDYELMLKVRDAETDSVRTATVTVSALQALPDLPLEVTVYTADFSGIVPFQASVLGIARGGKPPYAYEVFVDGVSLYNDDNVLVYITEEGNHEVLFRVTDANGTTVQDGVSIYGQLPEEDPLMRINFIAIPQVVERGKSTGLITQVYGGKAPFQFEIRVDNEVVSYEPTHLYQVDFLGEKIAEVKVTDATGMSSEIGLSIFGVEPYIYIPPVTVDVTASPYEAQQGEDISFHADVRGGNYDLVEWYVVGDPIEIGRGDDITRNFHDLGFEYVEARVYNWGNFLAADTVRVTITPADGPEIPTVDATATPWVGVAPFYTTLHADVRGGTPPYDVIWYDVNGNSIGCCNLYRLIDRPGEYMFEVRATDSLGQVAADTLIVSAESGDEQAMMVEVTGGPQGLPAPVDATLQAHPSGGDGNYHYWWYYPTAATLFSNERFPVYQDLEPGLHTFICKVTDDSGHEATDSVAITVLEPQGSGTVWWSFCPGLQVGPRDHFATTTAQIDTAGYYQSFIQFEWDTRLEDRGDCIAEIVLPNGHRWVWELYDVYHDRPKVVYYELGEVYLSGQMTLNLYWRESDKSDDGLKCDGWDKWQLISGSASIPADKVANAEVIYLDDPNRDAYIRRQ